MRRVSKKRAAQQEEYADWMLTVFNRDRRCKAPGCRSGSGLQAHHVYPKGTYPDLRLVPDNGLTLCRDCHSKWHAASRLHMEWWQRTYPARADFIKSLLDGKRVSADIEGASDGRG